MRWPFPAACALIAAPAAADLPPSLDRARIERCSPATVNAATDCLRDALGATGVAVMAEPRGAVYRAELHRLLYDSWRIADPTTPLARDLRRLNLYYPGLAPSFIVMNLIQRSQGRRPNWRRVGAGVRAQPMLMRLANEPPYVPVSPTAGGILLSAEECASATDGQPNVEACRRMPDGRLIVRTVGKMEEGPDAD